eukprot:Gb_36548 [translate_table: standard]
MTVCESTPPRLDEAEDRNPDVPNGLEEDCRDDYDSEKEEVEYRGLNDMWSLIRTEPRPDSSEAFGSLLAGKGGNLNSNSKSSWDLSTPAKPYVPYSRTRSTLSNDSLQLCTEGLGCESCDGLSCCSTPLVSDDEEESRFEEEEKEENSCLEVQNHAVRPQAAAARTFPPPLTSVSRCSTSYMRSYKKDGRFVLQAVKAPSQNYLQTYREGGRLKMQLLSRTEEAEDDDDEEDYSSTSESEEIDGEDEIEDAAESCSDNCDLGKRSELEATIQEFSPVKFKSGNGNKDAEPRDFPSSEKVWRVQLCIQDYSAMKNYCAFAFKIFSNIVLNSSLKVGKSDEDSSLFREPLIRDSGEVVKNGVVEIKFAACDLKQGKLLNEGKSANANSEASESKSPVKGSMSPDLNVYSGWRSELIARKMFKGSQNLQKAPSLLNYPVNRIKYADVVNLNVNVNVNVNESCALQKLRLKELGFGPRCQEAKSLCIWESPHCVATSS